MFSAFFKRCGMEEKITRLKEFKESENGSIFFYILLGFVLGMLVGTAIGRASRCESFAFFSNIGSGNRDNGCNNVSEVSK